jgi:hypothetical protein
MSKIRLERRVLTKALALSLLVNLISVDAARATPSPAIDIDFKGDALKLVAAQLNSAASLKSPSNRIKIRSLGVSLIAASDPSLARTTCREIESDFTELYSEVGEDEDANTTRMTDLLRAEAIRNISDGDATMALEVLRNTEAGMRRPLAAAAPEDSELEAYVAGRILDKDPRQAYELIRGSQSGRSYSPLLPDLIQRLRARDVGMARDAANDLADSLMHVDLASRQDAFFAAVGLITLSHATGGDGTMGGDERMRLLEKAEQADLLNRLVEAAASRPGAEKGLAAELAGLLPIAGDIAPEGAAALRRQLELPQRNAGRAVSGGSDFWERAGNRGVTDAVGLIGREPAEVRGVLYQQAAERAVASGDRNLAKGIAEKFIADVNERREIFKEIGREEMLRDVSAGDIASARSQLAQFVPEERAQLLIEAANGLRVGKDLKAALSLLEEARAALGGQPRNVRQLNLRLQLAEAFMRFDPAQAGEVIEGVVVQLNEVLSAAATLDGYLSDGPILSNGELDLSNTGAMIGVYLACAHDIGHLAQYDYERAEASADGFQRPETQLMAKLLVAEGVLRRAVPNVGDEAE